MVVFIVIFALILGQFSKLAPDNAAIQTLKGAYEFLARLFIDWGSPNPTLWIIGILIAFAAVLGLHRTV